MRQWIALVERFENTLSIDNVNDLISEFADSIEPNGETAHNECYHAEQMPPQLLMAGYPEEGFSVEYAERTLSPLSQKLIAGGWFLAKAHVSHYDDQDEFSGEPQIIIHFGWLPMHGPKADISPADELFHVCPAEKADEIRQNGLTLGKGGNDHITLENGRVYAVTFYDAIFDVAKDLQKHRGWNDFHVFKIEHEELPNHDWYDDIELHTIAVWTDKPIPASALTDYGSLT